MAMGLKRSWREASITSGGGGGSVFCTSQGSGMVEMHSSHSRLRAWPSFR